jgi:hypothetical protein
MQVQIRFTCSGSSALTGNFSPGDVLRCSKEWANHLVEDARCAEYVKAEKAATEEPKQESKAHSKSKGGAK